MSMPTTPEEWKEHYKGDYGVTFEDCEGCDEYNEEKARPGSITCFKRMCLSDNKKGKLAEILEEDMAITETPRM